MLYTQYHLILHLLNLLLHLFALVYGIYLLRGVRKELSLTVQPFLLLATIGSIIIAFDGIFNIHLYTLYRILGWVWSIAGLGALLIGISQKQIAIKSTLIVVGALFAIRSLAFLILQNHTNNAMTFTLLNLLFLLPAPIMLFTNLRSKDFLEHEDFGVAVIFAAHATYEVIPRLISLF